MVFEEYLTQKNIDAEKFLWGSPEQFQALKVVFNQLNPESFTAQKKFLINPLRRKYPLKVY